MLWNIVILLVGHIWEMHLLDKSNDLLGMGYASAEHVFVQFLGAMTSEREDPKKYDYYPLRTPIHVPFIK